MSLLALKAVMGNSRRSVHVVVAVAFSVAVIYSSFTVADGFFLKAYSMTEGYVSTDLFYVIEEGKSISESRLSETAVDGLPVGLTTCPVCYSLVEASPSGTQLELWGVDVERFQEVRHPRVTGDYPVDPEDVLVGASLANRYGIATGSLIEVPRGGEAVTLRVTGVMRSHCHYDDGLVAAMETLRTFTSLEDEISFIEVRAQDAAAFMDVAPRLAEPGVAIIPSKAMSTYINNVGLDIRQSLYVVSFVITALALVSITHTMYKIMMDSLSELLILRSIGITRKGVYVIVLLDSTVLSFVGAALGLVVGLVVSNAATVLIYLLVKTVYVQVRFDLTLALICMGLSVLMGVVGGALSLNAKRPPQEVYGAVSKL